MIKENLWGDNMGEVTTDNEYDNMCFVIMPIGELDIYPKDHFRQVYEDIFIPAIEKAGYKYKRADDDKASNMIQVNVIKDIVKAPMAICDLSTRNPNVLFELGIRQAFDLPVVLVQEKGTPRIFDISTINTIDYGKELSYREVLKDVDAIANAIISTKDTSKGINSVIKLLELSKANISETKMTSDNEDKLMLYNILNKLSTLESKVDYNSMMSLSISDNVLPPNDFTFIPTEKLESVIMETAILKGTKEALNLIGKLKKSIKESNSLSNAEKSKYMNKLGKIQNSIE